MSVKISIVGKGGTGKTTIASLLIEYLITRNKKPVLAIDADPNYNLNELLGVKVNLTLSEIKEEVLKGNVPSFFSKQQYLELKVNKALVEADGFDLLVMGYPEGPGCYCPVHAFLSQIFEKFLKNYPYVVIDNEAGMEHISRLNLRMMDNLIIISDPTLRGITTAARISELIKALKIEAKHLWLLVNRVNKTLSQDLKIFIEDVCNKYHLNFLDHLPEIEILNFYETKRVPVFLWDQNLKDAIYKIFDKIWKN